MLQIVLVKSIVSQKIQKIDRFLLIQLIKADRCFLLSNKTDRFSYNNIKKNSISSQESVPIQVNNITIKHFRLLFFFLPFFFV